MREIQPWKAVLIATMLFIVALVASCLGSTPFPVSPLAPTLYFVDNTLSADCPTYSLPARNCAGSDGIAYATINGAIKSVPPDSVIQIRGGEYRESVKVSNGSLAAFWVNKPLTLESYRGENVLLTYDPTNKPDDGKGHFGVIVALTSSNVVLDGLRITGTRALGDNGSGDTGTDSDVSVYMRSVGNVTLRNLTITDSGHAAIKADSLTGPLTVLNSDLAGGGFAARDHGIYISSRAETFPKLIQDNSIHGFAGYGIHVYGGGDIANVQILNNKITGNLTGGILLTGINDTVRGNMITGNSGGQFQQGGLIFNHYGLSGLYVVGNVITGNLKSDVNCQLDAGTVYSGNTFSGNTWGTVSGGGSICSQWEQQQSGSPTPSLTSGPITPTPTDTPTETLTETPTETETPTDTATPFSSSPTLTATYTPSATDTETPVSTFTPTFAPSPTPTTDYSWKCTVIGVTPIATRPSGAWKTFRVVTECDPE